MSQLADQKTSRIVAVVCRVMCFVSSRFVCVRVSILGECVCWHVDAKVTKITNKA